MKTNRNLALFGILAAALIVAAGCGDKAQSASEKSAAPTAAVNGGTGKVLETMDAGGYTYVKAAIGGSEVWAAAPQLKVKAGDVVTIPAGAPMANYHSNTLNRTFDLVYFVSSISIQGGGAVAANAPQGHGGSAAAKPVAVEIKGVEKAKGGKTVAEVFQGKADLAGKEVAVRGKVVKVSSGIMGKNWVHVQDGSGSAGTNDLTVTTDAVVKVGDTVLVQGKVTTNKDFGFGYKYDVIVENGTVAKE